MPWGFAAVAAATIGGAVLSSNAAGSAAKTQAGAADNATAAELAMFNTTQQNLDPYMKSGLTANNTLLQLLGLTGPGATGTPGAGSPLSLATYGNMPGVTAPQDFGAKQYQQSPGYQWQLSQGLGAISNAASAQGGVQSGNTLKALTTYGEGLANQDYQQAYNNYLNNYVNQLNSFNANSTTTFNRLQTLAGSGQNAAANLGSLSSQTAGDIGSNIIGAGNARAAGTVGAANAYTGGLNNLSQLAFLYNQNPSLFSSGAGSGSGALSVDQLNPGGFGG